MSIVVVMILLYEIDLHLCRGLRDKFDLSECGQGKYLRRVRPVELPGVRLQRLVLVYQFALDGIVS